MSFELIRKLKQLSWELFRRRTIWSTSLRTCLPIVSSCRLTATLSNISEWKVILVRQWLVVMTHGEWCWSRVRWCEDEDEDGWLCGGRVAVKVGNVRREKLVRKKKQWVICYSSSWEETGSTWRSDVYAGRRDECSWLSLLRLPVRVRDRNRVQTNVAQGSRRDVKIKLKVRWVPGNLITRI